MHVVRDAWNELGDISGWLTKLAAIAALLVAAVIIQRITIRVVRRSYWRRLDLSAAKAGPERLTRVKRQKTLATLFESLVRYGIYGAALVAAINIISPGATSAVFSATLLGVLIGFGFQRLLGDVVAGALLLFEGHFAVGDVITRHGEGGATGVVEEFSLRTTRLRTLGGDSVVLLNGSLNAFTRWSYGQREYRIDLAVRGLAGQRIVLGIVERESADDGSLWTRPIELVDLGGADHEPTRLRLRCVVSPEHDVLPAHLAATIATELGSELVGAPLVLPVRAEAFRDWQASLLVRD
ncbi:MAG: MscS Mechanosensitive ion channel [Thermoleophilia bacterium]|nr:MscS Mechanosensitive ion channel [Thermoleophilia bacterium]